jgi:hypothetical protein
VQKLGAPKKLWTVDLPTQNLRRLPWPLNNFGPTCAEKIKMIGVFYKFWIFRFCLSIIREKKILKKIQKIL